MDCCKNNVLFHHKLKKKHYGPANGGRSITDRTSDERGMMWSASHHDWPPSWMTPVMDDPGCDEEACISPWPRELWQYVTVAHAELVEG